MKEYKRDKRSPIPSSRVASHIMSSIRAQNTNPEITVRKLLWSTGLRGYRIHYKVAGKPDIAFVGKRIAIFIHGCYWHRCPYCCLSLPKSNKVFWAEKFTRNIERDDRKKKELEKMGWRVLIFWECKIKNSINKLFEELDDLLGEC